MGILESIKAFFTMVEKLADSFKTSKEVQSETEIVKDRKSLQKAVDTAEKMINITFKYTTVFDEKDYKEFKRLYNKFLKYN